jgi:Domain of unknown function (DUF4340)
MTKLYALLGLFVVLTGAAFFVNYDPSGRGRDRASALEEDKVAKLPAIDQARIHSFELSDAENKVRVARSGEKWVLPDKFNAPAMANKVNDLLAGLQGLDKAHRVTKTAAAARDKALGLEPDTAKRLRLFDDANKLIADLWVGKIDTSGDRNLAQAGNFVRMEGQDAVYSHGKRLLHLVMPQLSMWLDGRNFPIEQKEIDELLGKAERLTVEFDDVPIAMPGAPPESRPDETSPPARIRVVVTGKEAEQASESAPADLGPKQPSAANDAQKKRLQRDWTLVDPPDTGIKPYAPSVEQVLRALMFSRAEDVVGSDPALPEFGLDRPFADVEARFADGSTRHLRIGKPAPAPTEPTRRNQNFRYAHVDGVPRVFLVSEFILNQLRKKPADLKTPETPKGAPGGQPAPIELPKDGPETRR